jgi:DNA-binding GntR family transcriptional regulator
MVARALEEQIAQGQWAPGSRLPTEAELVALFGVSRQTLRYALSDLAARGLVRSHQGLGSVVLRQSAAPEYSQSLESINELVYYARNTTEKVIRTEDVILSAELAAMIGAMAGQRWCHALTQRTAAGQTAPMALSSVWVPAESRQAMQAARKSGLPVFLEIQKASGRMIGKVHQVLGASLPGKAQAKLLKCGLHEPLLRIQRWYYGADETLIEMSDTLHPPSRFQYAMTLRHSATNLHPAFPRTAKK